jgi:hypothetical protein
MQVKGLAYRITFDEAGKHTVEGFCSRRCSLVVRR